MGSFPFGDCEVFYDGVPANMPRHRTLRIQVLNRDVMGPHIVLDITQLPGDVCQMTLVILMAALVSVLEIFIMVDLTGLFQQL